MQAGGEVWRGTMGDAIVAVKKISESYRELKADVGTFGIVSVHEDLEREVAALTEMCVSVGGTCWPNTRGAQCYAIRLYRALFGVDGAGVIDSSPNLAPRCRRHPNLVKFLGTGLFEDETRFIVLEFMAKGSLRDLLDDMDQEIPWTCRMQVQTATSFSTPLFLILLLSWFLVGPHPNPFLPHADLL